MEEILASIRRIISEDEAPAEAAPEPAMPAPAPAPEPLYQEPHVAVSAGDDDDVLELTDRVEALEESHGDIDVYARQPEPEPRPIPREPPSWNGSDDEPLVGQLAAESAASAFASLGRTISMPADNRTLEDVVRELLRPLLKAWLDEHLPQIVQARVDAEVQRIARGVR